MAPQLDVTQATCDTVVSRFHLLLGCSFFVLRPIIKDPNGPHYDLIDSPVVLVLILDNLGQCNDFFSKLHEE